VVRREARVRGEHLFEVGERLFGPEERVDEDDWVKTITAGVGSRKADLLVEGLDAWTERRTGALESREQESGEYTRLQTLLRGRSLDELRLEVERVAEAASQRSHGLDVGELAQVEVGESSESRVAAMRDDASQRREQASVLAERLGERSAGVIGVSEAEECLAAAQTGLSRLRTRSRILSYARDFLGQAQEGVHRSIAPQLATAIAPRLHQVTAGRYAEVIVDPESLEVRVRAPGATWRDAALLSHGTAEQVYLLLRSVLATYLCGTGEPCPLFLDDPTAYADAARTVSVLEVLHQLSRERQVVVFSHDERVLEWAKARLEVSLDRVVELTSKIRPTPDPMTSAFA
jgi:DNA repair exonuclease SbcCD ATPase subunit